MNDFSSTAAFSSALFPSPEDAFGCCEASVHTAGDRCTCWEVETVEPQMPLQEGPVEVRRKACADCAYRMDSVERQRGEEPNPGGGPIYCHWDAPMVRRLVHPSGAVIEYAPGEAYDPVQHGDRYWRHDGSPQAFCAVWGALSRARGEIS